LEQLILEAMKAYLNASEIAKLLRVDRATVSRWLKKGLFRGALKPGDGTQWRVPLDAYEGLMKRGKP
jgi:excisionase family DNA binding protein